MKYVLFLCRTIKIFDLKLTSDAKIQPAITGREGSDAFDFAHHGHASVILYVQLCSDWSKFDR